MRRIVTSVITTVLITYAATASAQLRTERNITLALANEIAAAAVEACQTNGFSVTATVVDRAGQVKAVQRADGGGAGPHTVDSSRRKAYTAVSMGIGTSQMLDTVQKNPGAQFLPNIDGLLFVGGGMPIKASKEIVGGLGVSGAPGGHLDDQCVEAALGKVKDKLQ